jgi:hypothetical protein
VESLALQIEKEIFTIIDEAAWGFGGRAASSFALVAEMRT